MEKEQRGNRCQAFISHVISKMESDRAMRARLSRADNPATEYQSWEYLVPFGVDLERKPERRAFATVAAALARAKLKTDGTQGLGRAIASAYADGPVKPQDNPQAKARLRRLLACASSEEACDILRPLLQLLASKGAAVCYARLLRDLLYFSEQTRAHWAKDFFNSPAIEPQAPATQAEE